MTDTTPQQRKARPEPPKRPTPLDAKRMAEKRRTTPTVPAVGTPTK